jgi:hypothetical protein
MDKVQRGNILKLSTFRLTTLDGFLSQQKASASVEIPLRLNQVEEEVDKKKFPFVLIQRT